MLACALKKHYIALSPQLLLTNNHQFSAAKHNPKTLSSSSSSSSSLAPIQFHCRIFRMTLEAQFHNPKPKVRATLCLGSETYSVNANNGALSEQLVSMKEGSMSVLKEFITKHNVPNDVPDELDEGSSSEDDYETAEKPKTKLT